MYSDMLAVNGQNAIFLCTITKGIRLSSTRGLVNDGQLLSSSRKHQKLVSRTPSCNIFWAGVGGLGPTGHTARAFVCAEKLLCTNQAEVETVR